VGVPYFGRNSYIEYIPGDLPIIISAPHGGTLNAAELPDRTFGTFATDLNTQELARSISDSLFALTQKRPHIIICRLARVKLDANREIVEAAQGNRLAQRAWYEWHAYIRAAEDRVTTLSGRGLYMDLHGHGHEIKRLELGYLLSDDELRLPDATLLGSAFANASSIRELVSSSGSNLPQLLRGEFSLGAMFEQRGYPAVPSPSQPFPLVVDGVEEEYFSGGYNTEVHGSMFGGKISGFQLEAHRVGVRDTELNRGAFSGAIARVFEQYMQQHFNIDITP
jgi:hypothetical protein